MQRNLTQGSVSRTLLWFVLPFLGASVLQFLYSVTDMIIVGQFCDAAAITAVNTSSQLMQTVTSFITGITTGGTVLIGQYVGARQEKDVEQTVGTLLALFLVLGAGITVVLLCCNHLAISLMQVPEAAVIPARRYLLITSLGTLFIVGYNGVSGILRGMGDSRRPLYFIACSCVLNIFGDLLLVGALGWGAAGAALATAAAQGVSCLLSLVVLKRQVFPNLRLKSVRLDRARAKILLNLGIPISAQDVLVNLSFVIITAVVNHMGLNQAAAVGVVERIIGFCMLVPAAFLSALSAFTAQNVGAGAGERAKKGLQMALLLSFLGALLFFTLVELLAAQVAGLFTGDTEVISNCVLYLRTYGLDIIMVSFVFCFNGFFAGYGRTKFTMANCLISTFAIRVPLVFFFSLLPNTSLLFIGIAAPTASLLQIGMQLVYYKKGRWRLPE